MRQVDRSSWPWRRQRTDGDSTATVDDGQQVDDSLRSSSLPRLIRLTSSRSSTSRTSWFDLAVDDVRDPVAIRVGLPRRSNSTAVRIGCSGLRSSCASIARNSFLRRSPPPALRPGGAGCARFVQLRDGVLELRVRLDNALLQRAVEPLELRGLAIQIDEHADLGAQDLGHDRNRDVVDRAGRVALTRSRSVRWMAETKMIAVFWQRGCCANHRGELEAVELRHAHVHQHDRDVLA